MSRPILLSNGSLHVGINLYGMVHDLYYPYVGLENHAAAQQMRHRIGVWVEGQFSWLDDNNWQFKMDYEPKALIGHISAYNAKIEVGLEFSDCVDNNHNAFLRNIHVINAASRKREIRLFLHQMLLLGNSLNRDTGQYLPEEPALLHYKGDRAFVFSAKDSDCKPFQQFSIGVFGMEGKDGAYKDAEDGQLSGNTVDFGKVDSVMGFSIKLDALESTRIHYWMAAAKTPSDAIELHRVFKDCNFADHFTRTAQHWHRWLKPASTAIAALPKELHEPFRKSLFLVKAAIDKHGAVIASTDTTMLNYSRDSYAYCWPRDAALALRPFVRLGFKQELKQFFYFCRDAMQPGGFLMHKYQPDGAIGTSWHPYLVQGRMVPPIQEDETAVVIYLLGEYMAKQKDKKLLTELYDTLVVPSADFMADYVDPHTHLPRATYDLWEEKFLTTTYTVALVYGALRAAARMGEQLKRTHDAVRWNTAADEMHTAAHKLLYNKQKRFFYKGFINRGKQIGLEYDDIIDLSSLYGAYEFGLFAKDSPQVKTAHKTALAMYHIGESDPTIAGRYEHDNYDTVDVAGLGNPWFITTMWLAEYDLTHGNLKRAKKTLDWILKTMLQTGVLSEQVNPFNHSFISVAPLTWSQAEFLNFVLDMYGEGAQAPAKE